MRDAMKWVLSSLVLIAACSNVVGENGQLPDLAGGEPSVDLVATTEDAGDSSNEELRTAPDLTSPDVAVSTISGCVSCHTNKDLLVKLAPKEEVTESSGGG